LIGEEERKSTRRKTQGELIPKPWLQRYATPKVTPPGLEGEGKEGRNNGWERKKGGGGSVGGR
jgi:hypothetical protein